MPAGFNIGPLFIRFYGIIVMLGAVAAAWLAEREARRRGMNSDLVWDGLIWVLIGGIIGARLWHVFTPTVSNGLNPTTGQWVNPYFAGGTIRILDILSIWNGGLGIPGGVIGGGIALYFFCRSKRLNFLAWADIAAPAVALGQAIGRWANFANQELYGAPTNLPWAVHIDQAHRLPEYANVGTYHPLFLYESIWNFANMGLLLWLARRYPNRLKPGDLLLVYLIVYPVGRFFLEFLRLDVANVDGINPNQVLMAVVAVLATALLIFRHRFQKAAEPEEETGAEPVLEEAEETH